MSLFVKMTDKPRIIGVVGDVNTGKSMLLYNMVEAWSKAHTFRLFYYGLREDLPKGVRVNSVQEIEGIRNSIIIIDELSSLFDLDNRKIKTIIENSLRLINHNNNVLILCGVPENFKKFISAKLDMLIFKKSAIADFINGSRAKNILMAYRGVEKGSEVLNMGVGEALVYDGNHYSKVVVNYLPQYDTKRGNQSVLKSVPNRVPQNVL
jgi:hypothetical protein